MRKPCEDLSSEFVCLFLPTPFLAYIKYIFSSYFLYYKTPNVPINVHDRFFSRSSKAIITVGSCKDHYGTASVDNSYHNEGLMLCSAIWFVQFLLLVNCYDVQRKS